MTNDLLSGVLRMVHLTGALVFEMDLTGEWAIADNPTVGKLASSLPAGTSHVIVLHVVIEGQCWIRQPSAGWGVNVNAGQALVLPRGGPYEICSRPGRATVPFDSLLNGRPLSELRHIRLDMGPSPSTRVLCGFLGCDRRAFDPLCSALPSAFQVDMGARMHTLVPFVVTYALDDSPGAAGLRERVAELLYLGALRIYMGRLPGGASGWLAALRDPLIGRALQALHAEPSRHWSVDELAAVAGGSRSALATRFAELLNEAPMHYLARLRMSLAARALIDSRKSLAAIADEVGYESPAAFQRAFKRDFHVTPAAWRKNATERSVEAASLG